jgi:CheY-like chemotaxis protein
VSRLARLGVAAESCTSGEEALIHTLHENFDFVFVDVQLPGISAQDVLRIVQERSQAQAYLIGEPQSWWSKVSRRLSATKVLSRQDFASDAWLATLFGPSAVVV